MPSIFHLSQHIFGEIWPDPIATTFATCDVTTPKDGFERLTKMKTTVIHLSVGQLTFPLSSRSILPRSWCIYVCILRIYAWVVPCPELIYSHECRPRILVKNTENEVFQNQGIVDSHNFFRFTLYYQIKKTFNFLIRVTGGRSMCLTYRPVEATLDQTLVLTTPETFGLKLFWVQNSCSNISPI